MKVLVSLVLDLDEADAATLPGARPQLSRADSEPIRLAMLRVAAAVDEERRELRTTVRRRLLTLGGGAGRSQHA